MDDLISYYWIIDKDGGIIGESDNAEEAEDMALVLGGIVEVEHG